MNGHAEPVKTVASILDAAKKAAQRDQVCIRDVHGKRIVTVEARWMATLREESFRTWEFLVLMAKKVLQESSHNAILKDDKGDPVNLATIPSPGEYVWQLQATPEQGVAFVKTGPWIAVAMDTRDDEEDEIVAVVEPESTQYIKSQTTWKNMYENPWENMSRVDYFACEMCIRDGGCVVTGDALAVDITFNQIMPEAYADELGPLFKEMTGLNSSEFRDITNVVSLNLDWSRAFQTFRLALYPFGDHDVMPYAKVLILPFYELNMATAREDPDKSLSYTGWKDREYHGKAFDASVMCPRDPRRIKQMMPSRGLLLWHFEQCVSRCLREGCPEINGSVEADEAKQRKRSLRSYKANGKTR